MNILELGAIGELVGGVAVVASLVLVGLQVRHSNHLAQGAAKVENGRMMMDYLPVSAKGDLSSRAIRSRQATTSESGNASLSGGWRMKVRPARTR